MKKTKKKSVYICDVAWDHEIGETDVTVFPPNSLKPFKKHSTCGVVEVEMTLKKVVKKGKPFSKKNTLTGEQVTRSQIKSVKKEIKKNKAFLKKLKKSLKTIKKNKKDK